MSGTSLDGIDAALIRINDATNVSLVGFVSQPYEAAARTALERAFDQATARELAHLHVQCAEWAADAVEELLGTTGHAGRELGLIAFHGQTVWHEPPKVSWQLGEPAVLAEKFGTPVVHNFRARDVAAGGEGAPLVPMADVLLFGSETHPRVLLNLGGMANLTFVPRRGVLEGALAFDTGPGMAVIDAVARLADLTLSFDRDGVLSARGTANEPVLEELLHGSYFERTPPKSTGRERFGQAFAEALAARVPGPDGVRTAVELTARSIARAITRWVPEASDVVVSGGGVRHPVLMESLAKHLARLGVEGLELRRFDDLFFDGDAKEAVAFALLGYLTLQGAPGNLPAATGAEGLRVLGAITPP
jgi:anhydro-N-acetylmuramic acid kinase